MSYGSKAPEPTDADIARAAVAKAQEVYEGSDGRLTVAYYRRLQALGPMGVVAMNLFRAHKTSARAKVYRGRGYRAASYDTKNYSIEQLVAALAKVPELSWGWAYDAAAVHFEHVLYVDLPQGQASFHCGTRLAGPAYAREWDGLRLSKERILAFCDNLLFVHQVDGLECALLTSAAS
jgi:hypothetical protein